MTNKSKALSLVVLMVALFFGVIFLTSHSMQASTGSPPVVCTDYEVYKTASTALINSSAATYVDYKQGNITYDQAEKQTANIYIAALLKLSCSNIEETPSVLQIIRNTRDAIPAGKLSDPAVENMYIDQAFNLINDLNTNWGWEI